ncbi:DUF429 domain-containing protein [Conexibacter stalactiti]|uniref:DUF429 domain-containing protein n=1 Tax=Conexibacter stalactiti TaxID=1940611 RepID=A0ABU4I1G5_9ACTN|nr:DUF429 domain-containing protein [Conexibacter stalactiti]MDW5598762.1 DUF429 domain-containing protein [Conexibacter stalactiti]MEC5039404.1 DUF429 domain-containing protein [Conexibacter stalactiti]
MVLTVGVDLAAQDRNTALCVVRWHGREARVLEARRGISDEAILDAAERAADEHGGGGERAERAADGGAYAVGIDAPFGWPVAFERAIAAWTGGEPWPEPRSPVAAERDEQSRTLRLRLTDRWVARETGRVPLSVSTDLIGICAMRAAALLSAAAMRGDGSTGVAGAGESGMGVAGVGVAAAGARSLSRVHGPWFEVYPAAARWRWELPTANDKRDGALREARLATLEARVAEVGATLSLSAETRERCVASDDVLDALLCAFVARAAQLRRTHAPPSDPAGTIAREGWIHVPTGGVGDLFT